MPSKKIKSEIKYNDIIIRLYKYKLEDPISAESNIEAFDLENNLLWIAENCSRGRYFEMQIDELNNLLETNDGGSMHYEIELNKGKIISKRIIK